MVVSLLLYALLAVDAEDGGTDAGPDLFGPVITSQASQLAACAASVDGGESSVSVDFLVGDGGVERIRVIEPSKLGQCVSLLVWGFHFPPEVRGYRAQTFLIRRDGGVALGEFTGGGLDKDVLLAIIQSHTAEVRACYEEELEQNPMLAGGIWLKWVIGPEGAVVNAWIDRQTLSEPGVGLCILASVRKWEFPRPFGGGIVNVSFPYLFKTAPERSDTH